MLSQNDENVSDSDMSDKSVDWLNAYNY
jgi:hypothetical protein